MKISASDMKIMETMKTLTPFLSANTPNDVAWRYALLPSQAKESDYGELDENIVIVDTETTGLSFRHDELIQIAAARMEKGQIVEEFMTFVNPGKPIPDDIVYLTHIHDDQVKDAPSPEEALGDLVDFVKDAKIVAHNVEFDRGFTTQRLAGAPLLDNLWIDSLDLARIALPRMRSHRLVDLVKAFGAPLSTHRADDDVAATCALFRILLAAVDVMPDELVALIAKMVPPEIWSTVEVFRLFAERKNVKDKTFSLARLRKERLHSSKEQAGEQKSQHSSPSSDGSISESMLLKFPDEKEIDRAFSKDGLVGDFYPTYEQRGEQREMARAVRRAFETSENLAVEAGTGVGKSMAYLVPSALLAYRNDIGVGIATKTNALLDQLISTELPLLARSLPLKEGTPSKPLSYTALKGFTHYPCLRKIERLAAEGPRLKNLNNVMYSQAAPLAALLSFIDQTDYDDLDGLKVDYRLLPRRAVTTTSNECLRRKCPYFGTSCFVHGARRKAESAHIVVTNQSLLFCDVAAEGGLLPHLDFWIIDEAHGAEREARSALSKTIDAATIHRMLEKSPAFGQAMHYLTSDFEYALCNKARIAFDEFASAVKELCSHFADLLYFETGRKIKGYETCELWINDDIRASSVFSAIVGFAQVSADHAEKAITAMQDLVAILDDKEGAESCQREIASLTLFLRDFHQAADLICLHPQEPYVYSATLSKKHEQLDDKLEAQLLRVGDYLNETLFATTNSVVFSSATLAVGKSFQAFEEALGLNESEASRTRTLMLHSSFDFDHNMEIYVINDLPEPNDPRYLAALQGLLIDAHLAQGGSMLTLFTNRREMEACYDEVSPALKAHGLRLVCQKWGVSVKGLRDDFLADKSLSLFALKSFWEGFDAPGSTLRGVIVPKLPFAKPSDPLSCERLARDDAAWRRYTLPAAVLEVKQAAGRLIRKANDRGVLILADRRLVTKGYGKAFLNSMPSRNISVLSAHEAMERLRRFDA